MGVITLNSDEIVKLGVSASKGIHDEKAEADFAKLLQIQESIDNFVDEVKKQILKEAKDNDPNITGYQGKLLKFEFRKYGSKYRILSGFDKLAVDGGFAKVKQSVSLDTKAVDEYLKSSGTLPEFIVEKERPTTLTIKNV